MHTEDSLLPLSALQHLVFCERQCALIHLEQAWEENTFTTEGKHLHEKAHDGTAELHGRVLTVRSLRLRSLRLGLSGQADVVEFNLVEKEQEGVSLKGRPGKWIPFPVEYKRGRPKRDRSDEVQLCAQAICLEEMLDFPIGDGALFYGQTRRRFDVSFDAVLRKETESLSLRLHELYSSRITPEAIYEKKKCEKCSLINICQPKATTELKSVSNWFDRQLTKRLDEASLDQVEDCGSDQG